MPRMVVLAFCVFFTLFSSFAGAQTWPTKPVRMIIAYPAGGGVDMLGRLVSQKLSLILGQPVIVENRTGASGNIGYEYVAKSVPDGYTLTIGVGNMAVAPALSSKLPFNVLTDFSPISLIVSSQNFLVVRNSLPVHNVKELVTYAKANPGKLSYASSGMGTTTHLCIEMLKSLTGIDAVHVPYKGDAPALTDLIGGQVDMYCSTIVGLSNFYKTGKVRGIAVTSKRRAASMPEVPTVAESGVSAFDLTSWFGVIAAANTPRPIVDQLNAAIVKIVAMPDVQKVMIDQGFEPQSTTPDEFMERIDADVAKFGAVVKSAGIKLE